MSKCVFDIEDHCWRNAVLSVQGQIDCHQKRVDEFLSRQARSTTSSCSAFAQAGGSKYKPTYFAFLEHALHSLYTNTNFVSTPPQHTCLLLGLKERIHSCRHVAASLEDSAAMRIPVSESVMLKPHVIWPPKSTDVIAVPAFSHTLQYRWAGTCGKFMQKSVFWSLARHARDHDRPLDVVMFVKTMHYSQPAISRGRAQAKSAILNVARKHPKLQILVTTTASTAEYASILSRAKLVLSPWGFGEWSWKDFEALQAGAIVIKPAAQTVCFLDKVHCAHVHVDAAYTTLESVILAALANLRQLQARQLHIVSGIIKDGVHNYAQHVSRLVSTLLVPNFQQQLLQVVNDSCSCDVEGTGVMKSNERLTDNYRRGQALPMQLLTASSTGQRSQD